MTSEMILQSIAVTVSGWTLLEVVKLGREMARLAQKVQDLPCDVCAAQDLSRKVRRAAEGHS